MKSRFMVLFLALAMLAFVACFSNELGLWMQESVRAMTRDSAAVPKVLDVDDSQKIVGYRLVDAGRDARKVELRDFRASMDGSDKVDVTLTLVNNGAVSFPHLRVFMKAADSQILRTLDVNPEQYGAKGNFGKQLVTLHIPLLRGESRVAITPYYELESEE